MKRSWEKLFFFLSKLSEEYRPINNDNFLVPRLIVEKKSHTMYFSNIQFFHVKQSDINHELTQLYRQISAA